MSGEGRDGEEGWRGQKNKSSLTVPTPVYSRYGQTENIETVGESHLKPGYQLKYELIEISKVLE